MDSYDLFAGAAPAPRGFAPIAPTRAAGLERLRAFAPLMGRAYKSSRNYDYGPERRENVSMLSGHVRRRLVGENELVRAALSGRSLSTVEKFVQEVFWRTYWKGWLELRPGVWTEYWTALRADVERLADDQALRDRVEKAEAGATGIECFDAWARELVEHGYLHNHTRMWFASIWIFTLKLPWRLGADFFLRHLIDGDPASNTLSWRWVAGLQTRGKNYVAAAWNIEKFTDGRFNPALDLADRPAPLQQIGPTPPRLDAPRSHRAPLRGVRTAVLLTEDDLSVETTDLLDDLDIVAIGMAPLSDRRSPRDVGEGAARFDRDALADAARRLRGTPEAAFVSPGDVAAWARDSGAEQVVAPYAPVGWTADAMADLRSRLADVDVTCCEVQRRWDSVCWPKATAGFFKFKEFIPKFVADLVDSP